MIMLGMESKRIIAVIPARYQSTRFPGKPLAMILGKTMIQWVYERTSLAKAIDTVYVATDDERIYSHVKEFGGNAIMTGECSCGTDRVYQAVKDIDCDIIINVQGDEPTIVPDEINEIVSAFENNDVQMVTLKKKIKKEEEINNTNIVKVVCDNNNDALYFSRSRIPFSDRSDIPFDYYRHIGVYGYTKSFLKTFVDLPPSENEKIEKLEQLRALDNGYKIRTIETLYDNIGVDIEADIAGVEEKLKDMLQNE